MKKVLALVLAVMMMATVAFAADAINPWGTTGGNAIKNKVPGSKLEITDSGLINHGVTVAVKAVNSTNYSIAKTQWYEGKNLVESVKFDDANDKLVIKLKQDYTLTTTKELRGVINLKGKKVGKNSKAPDLEIQIGRSEADAKVGITTDMITVGYTLADNKTNNNGLKNPAILIDANNDAKVSEGDYSGLHFAVDASNADADSFLWKVVAAPEKQGTLEFTAIDGDTDIEVRVYDGDKLYLYNDVDADTDVLKAYADVDADITFLNFPGEPTFNSTATVRFYKEEDSFVYGVKDGKLTKVNAKWSDDEGCFVLKTRTLGSYVFSDKALNVSAPTASSQNPDTGANDVVGIATALAAVALVSAAAVSLKK